MAPNLPLWAPPYRQAVVVAFAPPPSNTPTPWRMAAAHDEPSIETSFSSLLFRKAARLQASFMGLQHTKTHGHNPYKKSACMMQTPHNYTVVSSKHQRLPVRGFTG
jgi:hypothetical protein